MALTFRKQNSSGGLPADLQIITSSDPLRGSIIPMTILADSPIKAGEIFSVSFTVNGADNPQTRTSKTSALGGNIDLYVCPEIATQNLQVNVTRVLTNETGSFPASSIIYHTITAALHDNWIRGNQKTSARVIAIKVDGDMEEDLIVKWTAQKPILDSTSATSFETKVNSTLPIDPTPAYDHDESQIIGRSTITANVAPLEPFILPIEIAETTQYDAPVLNILFNHGVIDDDLINALNSDAIPFAINSTIKNWDINYSIYLMLEETNKIIGIYQNVKTISLPIRMVAKSSAFEFTGPATIYYIVVDGANNTTYSEKLQLDVDRSEYGPINNPNFLPAPTLKPQHPAYNFDDYTNRTPFRIIIPVNKTSSHVEGDVIKLKMSLQVESGRNKGTPYDIKLPDAYKVQASDEGKPIILEIPHENLYNVDDARGPVSYIVEKNGDVLETKKSSSAEAYIDVVPPHNNLPLKA